MGRTIHVFRIERVLATFICGALVGAIIGCFAPHLIDRHEQVGIHQKPEPTFFKNRDSSPSSPYAYSERGLFAKDHRISGRVEGPVAMVEYHSIFVNNRRGGVGAEVRDEIQVSAGALIHSFSITERGTWYEAKVMAKSKARMDYQRTVNKSRDPGLIEFIDEDSYNFSLFPVLTDGTPKHAKFSVESVLNEEDGWLSLPLWQCYRSIRTLEVELTIHEPRVIEDWDLPKGIFCRPLSPGKYLITGTVSEIPCGTKKMVLRWKPKSSKSTLFACSQNGYILQIPNVRAGSERVMVSLLVANNPRHSKELGKIYPRKMDTSLSEPQTIVFPQEDPLPLDVSEGTFVRLGAMAQIMRLLHTRDILDEKEDVAKLALSHRMAGPLTSLYAKPGLQKDSSLDEVKNELVNFKSQKPLKTLTPRKRGKPGFRLFMGEFTLVPSFRKARERAGCRACFANQKTIAGAIEMFNLDNNTDIGFDPLRRNLAKTFRSKATISSLFMAQSDVLVEAVHRHTITYGDALTLNIRDDERIVWLAPYFSILQEGGYLQRVPDCPGEGDGSCTNYFLIGEELYCLRHGFVRAAMLGMRRTSARNQLKWAGVTDEGLLALASPRPPDESSRNRRCYFDIELLPALFVLTLLWLRGWKAPWRYEKAAFFTAFLPSLLLSLGFSDGESISTVIHLFFPLVIFYAIYELYRN